MSTYFSNHYGTLDADDTIGLDSPEAGFFVDPGAGHGRVRYKRMLANVPDQMAANDKIILGQFRTSDRIIDVRHVADDLSAGAATFDLGFFYSGTNHDGAELDRDVFEDGASAAAAIARTSVFEGASLGDLDYGKYIWELCGLSAAPRPQAVDLVFYLATGPADLGGSYLCEVDYTAGD